MKLINERGSGVESPHGGAFRDERGRVGRRVVGPVRSVPGGHESTGAVGPVRSVPGGHERCITRPGADGRSSATKDASGFGGQAEARAPVDDGRAPSELDGSDPSDQKHSGAGIVDLDLMKFREAICHGAIEEASSSIRNFIDNMYPSGPPTLFGEAADGFEIVGSIPRVCVEKSVELTARWCGVPEPFPWLAGRVAGWWVRSLESCDSAAQTFRVFDVAVYPGDLGRCKSVRDLVQHALQEEFQEKLERAVQPEGEKQVGRPGPVLVSENILRMSVDSPMAADSRLLILVSSLETPCKCRSASSADCFYAIECLHRR